VSNIRTVQRLVSAAALLLALSLAAFVPCLAADDLPTAEAAAKAGSESAEGKKFGDDLGEAFGREQASTIQRCAKVTKRPDLSNFDLFVRVDGAGVVDQALVNPPTNLAVCVRDTMPGWKVPAPPQAGFWVKVGVNLKSK